MESKLASFNELDWILKILYIRIVKPQNINPMHFYVNEQNLLSFLQEFSSLPTVYAHDLLLQFSPDQRTLLDFQGFRNLIYKIWSQYFQQIFELNLSPQSFLTGKFSETEGLVIGSLLML